jgi:hypothetical protein
MGEEGGVGEDRGTRVAVVRFRSTRPRRVRSRSSCNDPALPRAVTLSDDRCARNYARQALSAATRGVRQRLGAPLKAGAPTVASKRCPHPRPL